MTEMPNVRRRRLLMVAATSFALARAQAQPRGTVYRVGVLHAAAPFSRALIDRLASLGYRQGENLLVDDLVGDMQTDKVPAAAAQIASRHPDVIVAGGSESVLNAIERAAPATPIVMIFVDFDPVATAHIARLSHPGGNVTGVYPQQLDLAGKRLELLKEVVPWATRIGVLFNADTRGQLERAQDAAKTLRVRLLPQGLKGKPYDYGAAVGSAARDNAEAILILSSGEFFPDRFRIIDLIEHYRLPSMATPPFADAGALLCYGASFVKLFAMAGDYVHRILKGAKPADLAVEQPSHFELVINLKTAGKIGVHVPQSLLLRADQVIR